MVNTNIPEKEYQITSEQVEKWGSNRFSNNHAFAWLADILNGDYKVDDARDDCLSIVDKEQQDKEFQESQK